MFSRFCKNLNLNVSNSNNLLVTNRTTAPRRDPAGRQSPLSLDDIDTVSREPPPPYLEHYNHPVLRPVSGSTSGSQSPLHDRNECDQSLDHRQEDHGVRPDLVIASESSATASAAHQEIVTANCESSSSGGGSTAARIRGNDSVRTNIEISDIVESITNFKLLNDIEKSGAYGAESVNYNVMGQNLSSRKPSLSLTWLLRDQQNSRRQQQQPKQDYSKSSASSTISAATTTQLQRAPSPHHQHVHHQRKKSRSRNKDRLFSEKYVSENNLIQFNNDKDKIINSDKNLVLPKSNCNANVNTSNINNSVSGNNINNGYKNGEKIKNYNKPSAKEPSSAVNQPPSVQQQTQPPSEAQTQGLKYTYSEPSLYTAQSYDGGHSSKKHRHRKKREKYRTQNFGYEIKNVDEFLSKCSLASPGNIPVVLSSQSTLYQTRPGGYQMEIHLPLGMIVNAVFKNENWLYVQTPHAEEGYVAYSACLPLGILPPNQRSSSAQRQPPCWESNGDVFPRACGNMTDSEKELQLRGGTKSEGRPTPRLRRSTKMCSEKKFDTLYLRTTATTKPKTINQSFISQTTKLVSKHSNYEKANSEYGLVLSNRAKYEHFDDSKSVISSATTPVTAPSANNSNCVKSVRQVLLAITEKYVTDTISVQKGEVVTLLFKEELKQHHRHWFYIRKRDGQEGYIPAKVAGHGFL